MSTPQRALSAAAPSPAMESFEAIRNDRRGAGLPVLREAAMQRFRVLGIPTGREDSWRHTSLQALRRQHFAPPLDDPAGQAVHAVPFPAEDWLADADRVTRIVVRNGRPALENLAAEQGLRVRSLRDVLDGEPESLAPYFESGDRTQAWEHLNTALFGDGLLLDISAPLERPLLLVHLTADAGTATVNLPRVIVRVGAGAQAVLLEHYLSTGPGGVASANFCNAVTSLHLEAGARLEHYRVVAANAASTHIDTLNLRQGKDSHCRQFTILMSGELVRSNLDAVLAEPGAALESNSLIAGSNSGHIDCVAVATHAAPATHSRQTARSIASGTGRVIFNTKVVVAAGATHAQSQQSSRGLLLSPRAEIDTRPQLEIHTDEVKCAHGATTGRLDPQMFFYLLSRGIDRETAQSLLVFAFLDDVLTDMSLPAVRHAVETALIAELPDAERLRAFR